MYQIFKITGGLAPPEPSDAPPIHVTDSNRVQYTTIHSSITNTVATECPQVVRPTELYI